MVDIKLTSLDENQGQCIQMRLTQQLLELLLEGHPAHIALGAPGEKTVVSVAAEELHSKALHEEQTCYLVRVGSKGTGAVEGRVTHKLQPLRILKKAAVRTATRTAGAAATKKTGTAGRAAIVLPERQPVQVAKHAAANASNKAAVPHEAPPLQQQQRPTAAPQNAAATAGGQAALPASNLLQESTQAMQKVADKTATQNIAAASKGAPPSSPSPSHPLPLQLSGRAAEQLQRLGERVLAAARAGNVKLTLIALLATQDRAWTFHAIKSALETLKLGVVGFRPPVEEKNALQDWLRSVSAFEPPGRYGLLPGLEKELEGLPQLPVELGPTAAANDKTIGHTPETTPLRLRSTPSVPSSGAGTSGEGAGRGRAGSRPLSVSSRGSANAEESLVQEHAGRTPQPAPTINTAQEFSAVETEFQRRYEAYFRVHQLLAGNRRDFEALQAAADQASTEGERQRIDDEIGRLWERRSPRSARWEAAFKTLHTELGAWRAAMSEFVAKQQAAAAGGNAIGGSSSSSSSSSDSDDGSRSSSDSSSSESSSSDEEEHI